MNKNQGTSKSLSIKEWIAPKTSTAKEIADTESSSGTVFDGSSTGGSS